MDETKVQLCGKPNPAGVAKLYDAVVNWILAGRPVFACRECYSPLKSEDELKAGFCSAHLTSRHVYSYEEALEDSRRWQVRQARKAEKSAKAATL